jgi:hypothetical protein
MIRQLSSVLLSLFVVVHVCDGKLIADPTLMRQFLASYNNQAAAVNNKAVKISWNYYTNITNENLQKMVIYQLLITTNLYTVKPVLRGHLWDK